MLMFYHKIPRNCDYLPVLSPSQEIIDDVSYLKHHATSFIQSYLGMKGIAHITMKGNLMNKDMCLTERYLMELEKNWKNHYSIDLETNGFDYFNSTTGDTIYLKLKSTPVNRVWFKETLMKLNNKRKDFTPHITVTKNINHLAFKKLWPEYQAIDHSKKFRSNKLTILKRETYNKESHYEVFNELHFRDELFDEFVASKSFSKKYSTEIFPSQQSMLF